MKKFILSLLFSANIFSIGFSAELPDLFIKDLIIERSVSTETVYFSFEICNLGGPTDISPDGLDIIFSVNETFASVTFTERTDLPAGRCFSLILEEDKISADFSTPTDIHIIAAVDVENKIIESSETNNTLKQTIFFDRFSQTDFDYELIQAFAWEGSNHEFSAENFLPNWLEVSFYNDTTRNTMAVYEIYQGEQLVKTNNKTFSRNTKKIKFNNMNAELSSLASGEYRIKVALCDRYRDTSDMNDTDCAPAATTYFSLQNGSFQSENSAQSPPQFSPVEGEIYDLGSCRVVERAPNESDDYATLSFDSADAHPEIRRYRIYQNNKNWSGWYFPGKNDQSPTDPTKHIWKDFTNFPHRVEICGPEIDSPPGENQPQSLTENSAEISFSDIEPTDVLTDAAAFLSKNDVINGYPDGTFRPETPVNRAELAKFLMLAAGADFKNTTKFSADFLPDVARSEWYAPYVLKAAEFQAINGYPDGNFYPDRTVNTAEFLKMLTQTFEVETDLDHNFSDVWYTDWYASYAGAADKYDLFSTREVDKLEPAKLMSRREVAMALHQYLQAANPRNLTDRDPIWHSQ